MSDKPPFWQPGDSWQPPKVIFEGVDPKSPQAHELAKAFAPQIRSFYLGAAHNHELGSVEQSRSHRQFGDGLSMSYTRNQGRETVVVKVAQVKRSETPETKPTSTVPWDWLLIDIEMPWFAHTYSEYSPNAGNVEYAGGAAGARLSTPNRAAENPDGSEFGQAVSVGDDTASDEENPLVRFTGGDLDNNPGTYDYTDVHENRVADPDNDVQSLLVDVRPFATMPVIAVDLYAIMDGVPDDVGLPGLTGKYWCAKYIQMHAAPSETRIVTYFNTSAEQFLEWYPEYTGIPITEGSGSSYNDEFPSPSFSDTTDADLTAPYISQSIDDAHTESPLVAFNSSGTWVETSVGTIPSMYEAPYQPFPRTETTAFKWDPTFGYGTIRRVESWYNPNRFDADPNNTSISGPMPDPAPWPDYKYFRRLFQLDVTWFFAPNYGNPPIPITSTSAATIKARAFRGPDGMWQPTYYYNEAADNNGAHNAEQYRWELTDQYPERPELSIVAEGVTITSDIPGEGEEQYAGMRYIGRVTFVQETGSFAFAPA